MEQAASRPLVDRTEKAVRKLAAHPERLQQARVM